MRCFFRVRVEDPNNYIQEARGDVVVLWHNRILFFAPIFPRIVRERTTSLISASRDGQYVADLLRYFGVGSLRGSSSRRAASVQREAIRAIQDDGLHVCFTPDGPRGPLYKMKMGPIHLASLTGARIIPISVNATRYWSVRSWDRFQIPKPFSRLTLVLGDAVSVPRNASAEELEAVRLQVEEALNGITQDRPVK